jgi:hypothetical protein
MYEMKKLESYLRVNLLGTGPRLMKKEFTGWRSHRGSETLLYGTFILTCALWKSSFQPDFEQQIAHCHLALARTAA